MEDKYTITIKYLGKEGNNYSITGEKVVVAGEVYDLSLDLPVELESQRTEKMVSAKSLLEKIVENRTGTFIPAIMKIG